MDLEIVVTRETPQIAEMLLRGRVDLQTAARVSASIADLIGSGCRLLLLHVRWVRFIDSAGLSALLGAQREIVKGGGRLFLVHPSPAASRALELTHLTSAFVVCESREEAITALAQRA